MTNETENPGDVRVCLVCHTEPDVWDGGLRSIDAILPRFLAMLATVRDGNGRSPRVAWCLTGHVARHRPEPFRRLEESGHEIGVHSHFPSEPSGGLEHDQELNRRNLDDFASWFPQLCASITWAGFPPPRTHASWMFAYRDGMTAVLERCGITVDCSTCYGGAHRMADGFLLADSRKRVSGKPYRLSAADHCVPGRSGVVELPVSGGFGSYWEPDAAGGFCHFSPIASDAERDRQHGLFRARLSGLSAGELDIFHIHFHLYEFLPPDGTGSARLERARGLLNCLSRDPRVRFATPSEAAAEWSAAEPQSA